jgi:hypothetical protein
VLSCYTQELLQDVGGPDGYGTALVTWKDQHEIFRANDLGTTPAVLTPDLTSTFVERVYILVRTRREITIYRGYESKGLDAPFGRDHPSYIRNLVSQRRPGTPDGRWWTPSRPSMVIDRLGVSDMHRAEHRASSAIRLEWNRLDYYLESQLPIGSLIYVGRAAPQQESKVYGSHKYGGGGFQFRLTQRPETLPFMKRYQGF